MACCIARARWASVAVGTSSLQSYLFVPAATLAHQTALRAVAPGLNEKVDNPCLLRFVSVFPVAPFVNSVLSAPSVEPP